jgi:type IV pilus assembly protein PilN
MIFATSRPPLDSELSDSQPDFARLLAIFVLIGVAVSAAAYLLLDRANENQRSNNALLEREIALLDGQIKKIANLEVDIKALDERRSAVESLQALRNVPVRMLSALAQTTPDAVALTKLVQVQEALTISGVTKSNAEVAQYLANLDAMPTRFAGSELVETVLPEAGAGAGANWASHALNFSIRTDIVGAARKPPKPPPGAVSQRQKAGEKS